MSEQIKPPLSWDCNYALPLPSGLSCAGEGTGPSGPIEAADITDSSASGRTVLTGTPAEARAAIGMPDKVPGIYIIGSSTASNERPGTTYGSTAYGPVANGIALAGVLCPIIANTAVGGSLIATHQEQFAAAIATSPQVIYVQTFANDIATDATAATLYPIALDWANQSFNKKVHLVIRLGHYRPDFNVSRLKELMKLRSLLQELERSNQYLHIADGYSCAIDPANATPANRTNYTNTLHLFNKGAYMEGKNVWKPLIERLGFMGQFSYSDSWDAAGSGVQYLANPALAAAGGTVGTGAAGVCPGGYSISRTSGSGTVTGEMGTDSTGRPYFDLTGSGCADGDIFSLSSVSPATVPAGTYDVGIKISLLDSASLHHPMVRYFSSSQHSFFERANSASDRKAIGDDGAVFFLRQRVVTAAQDQASLQMFLYVRGTTGTFKVRVESLFMRRVTT